MFQFIKVVFQLLSITLGVFALLLLLLCPSILTIYAIIITFKYYSILLPVSFATGYCSLLYISKCSSIRDSDISIEGKEKI